MIRNLKDTTRKNTEQDWLKTNLAKFSRMLQGQKDLITVGRLILSELAPVVNAQHGAVLRARQRPASEPGLQLLASYAYQGPGRARHDVSSSAKGWSASARSSKERILLHERAARLHRDHRPASASAPPQNIIVLPVLFEGQVKAVLELASFERFSPTHQAFLDQLTESIGIVLNTIEANMRTEDLLKQSQSLAQELQSRQQELQQTNQELRGEGPACSRIRTSEVERKNREVEQARQGARREGQAARAHVEVQVRVPGEHVARAAHAAQQPADPVRPALARTRTATSRRSRSSSPRRSIRRATTC